MSGRPFKRESWRPAKRHPKFPAASQQPPLSGVNALPARAWGGVPVPTAPKRFEREVKEEAHLSRWDDKGSSSEKWDQRDWDQRDDRWRYGHSSNGKRRQSPSRQPAPTRDERFSSSRRSYSPLAHAPSPADPSSYPATRRPLQAAQSPASHHRTPARVRRLSSDYDTSGPAAKKRKNGVKGRESPDYGVGSREDMYVLYL